MQPEEIAECRVSIAINALKNIRELSTDSVIRKMAGNAIDEIIYVRVQHQPLDRASWQRGVEDAAAHLEAKYPLRKFRAAEIRALPFPGADK